MFNIIDTTVAINNKQKSSYVFIQGFHCLVMVARYNPEFIHTFDRVCILLANRRYGLPSTMLQPRLLGFDRNSGLSFCYQCISIKRLSGF